MGIVRMTKCAASLEENQGWTMQNTSSGIQLTLGEFCLTVGEHKDAQSGQPSAQLAKCGTGSVLSIDENGIQETDSGLCLDITANGEEKNEPVEWYKCNKRPNQIWQVRETPSHLNQIVSAMDGKCLSACGQPVHQPRVMFLI